MTPVAGPVAASAAALVWAGLLLGPPLVLLGSVALGKGWPGWARHVSLGCGIVLVGTVLAVRSGWRLATPAADTIWIMACYAAYLTMAAAALRIPVRLLRRGLVAVMSVPILAGYLLGTLGGLGLAFIVGDATRPPAEVTAMAEDLVCERTWWGSALTDSGYELTLYRPVAALPVLRRELASLSVDQNAHDPEATCADLLPRLGR